MSKNFSEFMNPPDGCMCDPVLNPKIDLVKLVAIANARDNVDHTTGLMINIEELMELGKAYSKLCRKDQPTELRDEYKVNLMEEIADVLIVIQNMMLEHCIGNDLINMWIEAKTNRNYKRVIGDPDDLE